MDLTDVQIERYSRQIILPAVGGRGQQRLLASTVSIIGQSALASAAARYLVAAGVGRTELYATTNAGRIVLEDAREHLRALNSDATVSAGSLPRDGSPPLSPRAALICADVPIDVLNAVNHTALQQRAPLFAGVTHPTARVAVYAGHAPAAPCARCDPNPPVTQTDMAGAEATAGILGSILALEAIKTCLGLPGCAAGRSLLFAPETLTIRECHVAKHAHCPACAQITTADA